MPAATRAQAPKETKGSIRWGGPLTKEPMGGMGARNVCIELETEREYLY